jgi:N-acetylglucosaminyldiphosphoundecaprenol N-acetyl-beta-D-mannosaminyltransferase
VNTLTIGRLPVHRLTRHEALQAIEALVRSGRGGAVFTPNVDHVVLAEHDDRMCEAYSHADLSFADGMPLIWASRLLGEAVPERVAGSDLVPALLELAAHRGFRVYFLGGAPGVSALARDNLRKELPALRVVGVDAPRIGDDGESKEQDEIIARIRTASPHLVFVALGAPKQEIWIHRVRNELRPAVFMGVGASLDFIAGAVPRAPHWMSRVGLEWFFRLMREPRRLWRRYLLRDPLFLVIVGRALRDRNRARPYSA